MVSVYRALTGQSRGADNVFAGISLKRLAQYGANAINGDAPFFALHESLEETARNVGGLPVFLDKSKAVEFLARKEYRNESKATAVAALASIAIDTQLIADGAVKIMYNSKSILSYEDQTLDLDRLLKHEAGEEVITGECYIPSYCMDRLPASISTLFIPKAHTLDGQIDMGLDDPFIDINQLNPDWKAGFEPTDYKSVLRALDEIAKRQP